MTPVIPLVAKLGNAWILTLHQLKTLKTDRKSNSKIRGRINDFFLMWMRKVGETKAANFSLLYKEI